MKNILIAGSVAAALFSTSTALAEDCKTDVKKADLTAEQVQGLYDCIKTELREGYASKDGANTKEYQNWKVTATGPATAGVHGKRFLLTFVNDIGFDEYVKYSEERGPMPVGSIVAKESFNVSKKKGKVKKGPLFFMTKVAAGGEADKFGNWVYSAVRPNGKPMKVKQKFCHGCHGNYDTQDALGYPQEDVRLKAG